MKVYLVYNSFGDLANIFSDAEKVCAYIYNEEKEYTDNVIYLENLFNELNQYLLLNDKAGKHWIFNKEWVIEEREML